MAQVRGSRWLPGFQGCGRQRAFLAESSWPRPVVQSGAGDLTAQGAPVNDQLASCGLPWGMGTRGPSRGFCTPLCTLPVHQEPRCPPLCSSWQKPATVFLGSRPPVGPPRAPCSCTRCALNPPPEQEVCVFRPHGRVWQCSGRSLRLPPCWGLPKSLPPEHGPCISPQAPAASSPALCSASQPGAPLGLAAWAVFVFLSLGLLTPGPDPSFRWWSSPVGGTGAWGAELASPLSQAGAQSQPWDLEQVTQPL